MTSYTTKTNFSVSVNHQLQWAVLHFKWKKDISFRTMEGWFYSVLSMNANFFLFFDVVDMFKYSNVTISCDVPKRSVMSSKISFFYEYLLLLCYMIFKLIICAPYLFYNTKICANKDSNTFSLHTRYCSNCASVYRHVSTSSTERDRIYKVSGANFI